MLTGRDLLLSAAAHLAGRVAELERLVLALSERCAGQSELLAKRAEGKSDG